MTTRGGTTDFFADRYFAHKYFARGYWQGRRAIGGYGPDGKPVRKKKRVFPAWDEAKKALVPLIRKARPLSAASVSIPLSFFSGRRAEGAPTSLPHPSLSAPSTLYSVLLALRQEQTGKKVEEVQEELSSYTIEAIGRLFSEAEDFYVEYKRKQDEEDLLLIALVSNYYFGIRVVH